MRTFVDSNILIYAHDGDAGVRHRNAANRLEELWVSGEGLLSTQVLQEFFVNVTRKIRKPLSASVAREVVRDYTPWATSPITPSTILRASEISDIWQISFWDGMIVAAAEQAGARVLLTEDLNDGQKIAGVEVVNPFR
jgi:predicted nucleic acid-binding protein